MSAAPTPELAQPTRRVRRYQASLYDSSQPTPTMSCSLIAGILDLVRGTDPAQGKFRGGPPPPST